MHCLITVQFQCNVSTQQMQDELCFLRTKHFQLHFSIIFFRQMFQFTQNSHDMTIWPELWLAPLQVARATSAATFSVAPGQAQLLFKIYRAANILTTFKRCANS